MTRLKNDKHELFLREYFSSGWNATQAYKAVYGPVKSAYQQAHKLLKKPAIQKRYQQMVNRMTKRADITEEKILTQYQEAYDMARDQGKTADMVSASTAQAKLVGMLKDRVEHGAPGEFNHLDNISDVLEAIEQQAGSDVARKLGQALGVMKETQPEEDIAQLAAAPAASDSVN